MRSRDSQTLATRSAFHRQDLCREDSLNTRGLFAPGHSIREPASPETSKCLAMIRPTASPPHRDILRSMRQFPLLLCLSLVAVAQEEGPPQRGAGSQEPINATTFASLRVRNIGPACRSGIAWRSSRGNAMVFRRTRRRAGTFFRVSSVLICPV